MHKQIGSSFIEIIISMLLVSIILLGLDGMQIVALREAKSVYYFSVAIRQLKNMSERLDTIATTEVTEETEKWNQQNQEVLPQGKGIIQDYSPAIFWGGASEQTCKKNTVGQSGCLYF